MICLETFDVYTAFSCTWNAINFVLLKLVKKKKNGKSSAISI